MKKKREAKKEDSQRTIYDIIGISGEILANEPKIVVTGDYLVEIFNHKGIVDFSDTFINVNTKKCIYKISGVNLEIRGISDDQVSISGTVIAIERIR